METDRRRAEPGRAKPSARADDVVTPDWSRLLQSRTPAELVERFGPELDAWAAGLRLVSTDPLEGELARWCGRRAAAAPARRIVLVPGAPPWRLTLDLLEPGPGSNALAQRLGLAVEIWRHTRHEWERAASGLEARSRELHLLQSLGRRCAEARNAADLFAWTVSLLEQGAELDLVVVGCGPEAGGGTVAYLSRPFAPEYLEAVERRAAGFLGGEPPDDPPRRIELDTFDPARGARRAFREEDVVLLPLVRRGRPVACLLVVPAGEAAECELRVLYSATNQLSLHLDRILTVREAEAGRFRSVVDSMPQGVLLADDRLRLRHANRSARQLFDSAGLELAEDLRPATARLGLDDVVERVRAGAERLANEEVRPGDGRVWNVTVSPLPAEAGGVDDLVLVVTDVSASRRLHDQLAQSEKMSSLGQMLSGVAHELNNPLASILGYAQLLRRSTDDAKLVERLEILGRESERCRKIVENLLSFARRREPERKPLSLNQVVRNVLALMEYQLRVADVRVEAVLSGDIPTIHGDAHQLEQALVNLLTNARQAIRKNAPSGTVVVETARAGTDAVRLEVRDDGPGIPAGARSRIFDPFFTTKKPGEGTGLGLSLVYGLVTAHGGTVEALPVRADGGGTRFLIRLPVGRAEPQTRRAAAPAPEPQTVVRPGRILVVDDEEPLARLICDTLAADGHRTASAADGKQALERLAEETFDLIISDVRMPGMGGERLFEALCGVEPGWGARMLLTTGDTVSDEPEEIAARTGLELLRKPFDLDELRSRVRARLAAPNGPCDT